MLGMVNNKNNFKKKLKKRRYFEELSTGKCVSSRVLEKGVVTFVRNGKQLRKIKIKKEP